MANDVRILLVSPDLLATSRIAALARPVSARLETIRSLDETPHAGPFDIVLLDLQSLAGDAAVLVAKASKIVESQKASSGRGAKVIAFGPHVHKERLADAEAAGADAAVSRGELLGSFPGLVRRWLG